MSRLMFLLGLKSLLTTVRLRGEWHLKESSMLKLPNDGDVKKTLSVMLTSGNIWSGMKAVLMVIWLVPGKLLFPVDVIGRRCYVTYGQYTVIYNDWIKGL